MNKLVNKIILFIMLSLFSCFGIAADTKTGITTTPEDVTFSATSFVRIGFSKYPVESTAKPADDWVLSGASFEGPINTILSTGTCFLYAQVFMVKNVVVSVTAATSLFFGNTPYDWSTEFVPYGWDGTTQSIKSSSFNQVELLRENLPEEDLAYPRTYCWSFNVSFDDVYPQPNGMVSSGLFKVHIEPVE